MDSDSDSGDCWMFSSGSEFSDEEPCKPVPVKRGKKSLAEQHPQLVPVITDYIQQHSAEAHNRRRDATAYTNGVSLADIKKHVESNVSGLNSISRVTIHRLMKPARSTSRNAKRHSGLVDARVPPKVNKRSKEHQDFHSTCASINYMNELAFLCENESVCLSCDDKNKINVGTLAVSRHFQINRFFHRKDMPNYPDHDYPYIDSKLIPSGYMRLERKRRSRSESPKPRKHGNIRRRHHSAPPQSIRQPENITRDKMGRNRVNWPRTGPLMIHLQAGRFHTSTSQSHACHLIDLLEPVVKDKLNPKSVATIIADGGPDWSTKSSVNLINFGRVWRDLDLDALVIASYAPGQSRFNPIERAWAPISKWLTGVTLPITLPGEDNPPCRQNHLTKKERISKEIKIFDNAMDACSKYWEGKRYNSFPVMTHRQPCRQSTRRYNDHQLLKEFVDASATAIRTTPALSLLREELDFFNNHCFRRKYQLEFYKCQDANCSFCLSRPRRATKFFQLLDRLGGKLPSPVPDVSRTKGEFMSLLQLLDHPQHVNTRLGPETCDICCRYVFVTKRDQKRHMTLCHPRR